MGGVVVSQPTGCDTSAVQDIATLHQSMQTAVMRNTRFTFLAFITAILVPLGASSASSADDQHAKLVAITFDDLPFAGAAQGSTPDAERVNEAIRQVLVRWKVPATGFVTEKNVEALGGTGPLLLRSWMRSGLDLGNHGATHADSNDLDVSGVRQEIVAGEATIAPLAKEFGRSLSFYRFAYNHVGDTNAKRLAIGTLLAERGYRLAASTIDTSDYLFDQAYSNAADNAATRQRIEQAYLDHSRIQIRYYRALNMQVLGREPPAIMLLHMNQLNAATLDRLLAIFQTEGFRFVSLDAAQADEAYKHASTTVTRFGPMWGYRWARERGVKIDGSKEEEPPVWVQKLAEANAAGEQPAARPQPIDDNEEMSRLFDADQAARKNLKPEMLTDQDFVTRFVRADVERRATAKTLLQNGGLKTAQDFYGAAFIFQHGNSPDDYLLAHSLALAAVSLGKADAAWIAAATLDRFLQKVDHSQIYGTQFSSSPQTGPTMEPYDRALIPDTLRSALGVPIQSEQDKRLERMKADSTIIGK